jgi:Rrf2 family protein
MISQKAKYALRALLALARAPAGAPVYASVLAAGQSIPRKFLEQILMELRRGGLVVSRRGKLGGYALGRPAAAITFGEVLRAVDGPLAPLACVSRVAYRRCADCASEGECELRRVMARVAEATRAVLDRTTLADALAESASAASVAPAVAAVDAEVAA